MYYEYLRIIHLSSPGLWDGLIRWLLPSHRQQSGCGVGSSLQDAEVVSKESYLEQVMVSSQLRDAVSVPSSASEESVIYMAIRACCLWNVFRSFLLTHS